MSTPVQFEAWQLRLKDERTRILNETLKLKAAMDDPNVKMSLKEWELLRVQFGAMREYLQALTSRCIHYGLMEGGDLGLHY